MMFQRLLTVGLALAFLTGVSSVQAANTGKKKSKEHHVKGIVMSMKQDKDKDSGSITIKEFHKTGAKTKVEGKEVKFHVNEHTKFVTVSGMKGSKVVTPAKFADLQDGETVKVVMKAGHPHLAHEVQIHIGKKGKKQA